MHRPHLACINLGEWDYCRQVIRNRSYGPAGTGILYSVQHTVCMFSYLCIRPELCVLTLFSVSLTTRLAIKKKKNICRYIIISGHCHHRPQTINGLCPKMILIEQMAHEYATN